jgi:hypothetical protein
MCVYFFCICSYLCGQNLMGFEFLERSELFANIMQEIKHLFYRCIQLLFKTLFSDVETCPEM